LQQKGVKKKKGSVNKTAKELFKALFELEISNSGGTKQASFI